MNRRQAFLKVEDIFISEGKAKYISRRDIRPEHVAEALGNNPRFFVRVNEDRDQYSMLGTVDSGRFLLVAIEPLDGSTWRLITAYWLREREGRGYTRSENEEAQ